MGLLEIRDKINTVDDQLLKLFLERMELSREVAEEKTKQNLPILNTKREREVLSRISANSGDMDGYARILFSTLFELSRSYQGSCMGTTTSKLAEKIYAALDETPKLFPAKAVVACQGIEGANSQQACDRMFSFADIMYFKNFEGVFNAVEKGLCEYGVLPIENSAHGSVNDVYDLMQGHSFNIVRSIKQHISHNLLVLPGTKLSDIKEVISHPQAIGQCSSFIAKIGAKSTYVENTAVAAEMLAGMGRRDVAAISSEECAAMYGLEILKGNIQNTDNNYTRFIAISKKLEIYPGSGKISLMFTTTDTPGSLSRIMSRFSSIGVNLSKIESRPMSGSDFKYVFYTDLDASVYSEEVIKLLSEMERELKFFVFLGSYQEIV